MKCPEVKSTDITAQIEKIIAEYKSSGPTDMGADAECLVRIHNVGIENVLAYFGIIGI